MTREQLIEAMSLLGFVEVTDYTIDQDYASIVMVQPEVVEGEPEPEEVVKPLESDLQSAYDTEQERQRKLAVQARLDAIPNMAEVVAKYVEQAVGEVTDNDSLNVALLKDVDSFELDSCWNFANIAKPSLEDLEALVATVQAAETQRQTNEDNLKFLADTDWKVLRHLREQALGVTTSMTQTEYEALEQERQDKAKAIVR